jgi:hypothetical protein
VILVVVLSLVANDRAGFVKVTERIYIQALIVHTTVYGFNLHIAPGLSWWKVVKARLTISEFVARVGHEFGPVIAPQHQRCSAWSFIFYVNLITFAVEIERSVLSRNESLV